MRLAFKRRGAEEVYKLYSMPMDNTLKRNEDGDPIDGEVSSVFANIGKVDSYNTILDSGALKRQSVFLSAWNHDSAPSSDFFSFDPGKLPAGAGDITEDEEQRNGVFNGRFNLKTARGSDAYEIVKQTAELMDWSFYFRVLDEEPIEHEDGSKDSCWLMKEVDVAEVSPVMRGAGQNTFTLNIKGDSSELKSYIQEALEKSTAPLKKPDFDDELRRIDLLILDQRIKELNHART